MSIIFGCIISIKICVIVLNVQSIQLQEHISILWNVIQMIEMLHSSKKKKKISLFYFILFYFILFYFILFSLFYFILFYFILFYFILFYFNFILFYFILFYFILFYF